MIRATYCLFTYMERELKKTLATLIKNYLSKGNNNNKEMEDNKVDEENKENILKNELHIVQFNNKVVQISPVQEKEEYD